MAKSIAETAKEVFKTFAHKEGNEYIATAPALIGVGNLIKKNASKSVLEVGIGIGTIPYFVSKLLKQDTISADAITYYGTEDHAYCIEQFQKNMVDLSPKLHFTHIVNLSEIPAGITFDFVVIDGGDLALQSIKEHVHSRTVIMVEGDRKNQRNVLMQMFGDNVSAYGVVSNKTAPSYNPKGKGKKEGGYTVFLLNATTSEKIFCYCQNKITALKERFRFLEF